MVSKKMRDGCGTFVPTLVDDAVDDDDDDDDDDARRFGLFFTRSETDGRTDGRCTKRRSTAPNRDRSRGNVDDSLVSAKRRNEEEGDRGDGDDEIRGRSGTTSGCGERRRARLNSNRRDGGQDERKRGEEERQVDAGEADAAEEAERRRGLDAVLAGWRTRNAETRRGFGSGGTDEEDGG